MTWWLPALAFAIVTTVIAFLERNLAAVEMGQSLMDGVLWGVIAAGIVGVAIVAVYFGYKNMLNRSS
jgi:hypothetical protein